MEGGRGLRRRGGVGAVSVVCVGVEGGGKDLVGKVCGVWSGLARNKKKEKSESSGQGLTKVE